jgi:hypothetical protein
MSETSKKSEAEIQKAVGFLKEGRDHVKKWLTQQGVMDEKTGVFVRECYFIFRQGSRSNITIEQFANVTDIEIDAAVRWITKD